ncbi:MAG TPA: Holliday junction branch migration protein RuvA [Candidatus Kapabacteria bacterium]|nr:Holliday junction branch migration protein RuvA [Candidatus Kapabacteria bacterium]
MIDYLEGTLVYKHSNIAVIDISGIGFKLNISIQCFDKLPELNTKLMLYTIVKPKEDDIQIYGFIDRAERELFELITTVSGIGPKLGLLILSSVNSNEFINMVSSEDLISLQKMQGIGKKTAERLVFELKDKIKTLSFVVYDATNKFELTTNKVHSEAIMALVSLGYSKQSAEKSVQQAAKDLDNHQLTVENLIRMALRFAIK